MNQPDPLPQRLAAEHATEPLLVTDGERVRFANQAFANLVGVPLEEIEGRGVDQIITIIDEPMVLERLRNALRQGQPYRGEATCHTASGGTVPVELTVIPITTGAETLYVVSGTDLRHRKRLEHKLWQNQRLDAVTQLVDWISHEMNDAVQVIAGFAELSGQAPRQLKREDVKVIEQASRRAARLLSQLLEFARRRPAVRSPLDLNEVIAQWESLLQSMVGADIRFLIDLERPVPPVFADRSEVQHILINLVANARDAMPSGGTVTITTRTVKPDQQISSGGLDERLGEYVVMSVADTGMGMTAETKANLFQPFFTTKDAPGTRGLGLATVQEIVREAGGLLWVRSQPNVGTSVDIHFPALAPSATLADAEPPPAPPRQGHETILLVDDDPGVLRFAQRGLELYGYRVIAAQSAAEATAIAAERGGEIALLVTDVMMPGQRGTGLAQELLADWPHLKVLFISGYADDEASDVVRRAAYLGKPFSIEALAGAARSALET